jgi:hypothetical protein
MIPLTKPAGFYQFEQGANTSGWSVNWEGLYRYIATFVVVTAEWAIFRDGVLCPSGAEIVQPGTYVLLASGE